MTVSPTDGKLYLTDFQNKQVLRVKETQPENLPSDITTNFEVIAGTYPLLLLICVIVDPLLELSFLQPQETTPKILLKS